VLSQAVEAELLEANPVLRLGRYLRRGDEAEPSIDPFTWGEVAHLNVDRIRCATRLRHCCSKPACPSRM
jgi:hypothetical protein